MESRFLFAHLVVKETSGVAGDLLCIPIIEDGAAPGRFFVVEPPPFNLPIDDELSIATIVCEKTHAAHTVLKTRSRSTVYSLCIKKTPS